MKDTQHTSEAIMTFERGYGPEDMPNPFLQMKDEILTPNLYVLAAHDLFGGHIDLDPASSQQANKRVRADQYYDRNDDGLQHDWFGSVWLFPPQGQEERWADKLLREFTAGYVKQALFLVNAQTHASWFQRFLEQALPVCFLNHRLLCESPLRSKPYDVLSSPCFFYLGPREGQTQFVSLFRPFGVILNLPVGDKEDETHLSSPKGKRPRKPTQRTPKDKDKDKDKANE